MISDKADGDIEKLFQPFILNIMIKFGASWKNRKIESFIDGYNWEGISYLSEKQNWKKIEKNNLNTAFNVLHTKILSMFWNQTQSVKNKLLSWWFQMGKVDIILIICFIKRNNSKKNGDFYCLNCLHSFRIKKT